MVLPAAHSCHADIRQELSAMKRRREEEEGEEEGWKEGQKEEEQKEEGDFFFEEWKIRAGVAALYRFSYIYKYLYFV